MTSLSEINPSKAIVIDHASANKEVSEGESYGKKETYAPKKNRKLSETLKSYKQTDQSHENKQDFQKFIKEFDSKIQKHPELFNKSSTDSHAKDILHSAFPRQEILNFAKGHATPLARFAALRQLRLRLASLGASSSLLVDLDDICTELYIEYRQEMDSQLNTWDEVTSFVERNGKAPLTAEDLYLFPNMVADEWSASKVIKEILARYKSISFMNALEHFEKCCDIDLESTHSSDYQIHIRSFLSKMNQLRLIRQIIDESSKRLKSIISENKLDVILTSKILLPTIAIVESKQANNKILKETIIDFSSEFNNPLLFSNSDSLSFFQQLMMSVPHDLFLNINSRENILTTFKSIADEFENEDFLENDYLKDL